MSGKEFIEIERVAKQLAYLARKLGKIEGLVQVLLHSRKKRRIIPHYNFSFPESNNIFKQPQPKPEHEIYPPPPPPLERQSRLWRHFDHDEIPQLENIPPVRKKLVLPQAYAEYFRDEEDDPEEQDFIEPNPDFLVQPQPTKFALPQAFRPEMFEDEEEMPLPLEEEIFEVKHEPPPLPEQQYSQPVPPLPVVQADPIRDRMAKNRVFMAPEPDEPYDPNFGDGRRRVSRKLKRR
jgi:hypothetical protein